MKIIISSEGCKRNGMDITDVLLLLKHSMPPNEEQSQKKLIENGLITAERDQNHQPIGWRVTKKGLDLLESVFIESDKEDKSMEELLDIADGLKTIFPQGRKEGTSNYWAESKLLIAKRLKSFFKRYGSDYTKEQILEAAKKYVEGFNGRYQYMRTLKYFIFRDRNTLGEAEASSDLLTYIENAGQEQNLKDDWMQNIV